MNQPSGFGDDRNNGTQDKVQHNLDDLQKQAVESPLGLLLAIQQRQRQQQQQQVSINVPQLQSQPVASNDSALVQQYLFQIDIAHQLKQQRKREQQAQQQRLESLLLQGIGLLATQPQQASPAAASRTSISQNVLQQLRVQQLQNAILANPITELLRAETNVTRQQQQPQGTIAATNTTASAGEASQAQQGIGAWSATSAVALRDMVSMTKSDKTVDCPMKSKRMSLINKEQDKNKPKRPLSAYNIFFKEERQRILQSIPDEQAVPSTDKRKRKKTPHGKIGFQDLARMIGKRWNELNNEELEYYRGRAFEDSERYKCELAEYSSTAQTTEKVSGNANDGPFSSSYHRIPAPENNKKKCMTSRKLEVKRTMYRLILSQTDIFRASNSIKSNSMYNIYRPIFSF
jgi:hypothetical protein